MVYRFCQFYNYNNPFFYLHYYNLLLILSILSSMFYDTLNLKMSVLNNKKHFVLKIIILYTLISIKIDVFHRN